MLDTSLIIYPSATSLAKVQMQYFRIVGPYSLHSLCASLMLILGRVKIDLFSFLPSLIISSLKMHSLISFGEWNSNWLY
uniref:Uncharacterized protein n=1 Tax=Anguilla anguilla TaxID=7936 RepID=A0A0E9RMM0_ANGAN